MPASFISHRFFGSTLLFAALLIALPSKAANQAPVVLNFSSLGGNPPPGQLTIIANGSFSFQNVNFKVPNTEPIYIFGTNTQPFVNKSLNLWTYDPQGLTITFPQPIVDLSFEDGEVTPVTDVAVNRVFANGLTPFNFTLSHTSLHTVDIPFPTPVTSVQIIFQGGSESLMGIDTLSYTPLPEPGVATILLAVACTGRFRRRRQARN